MNDARTAAIEDLDYFQLCDRVQGLVKVFSERPAPGYKSTFGELVNTITGTCSRMRENLSALQNMRDLGLSIDGYIASMETYQLGSEYICKLHDLLEAAIDENTNYLELKSQSISSVLNVHTGGILPSDFEIRLEKEESRILAHKETTASLPVPVGSLASSSDAKLPTGSLELTRSASDYESKLGPPEIQS